MLTPLAGPLKLLKVYVKTGSAIAGDILVAVKAVIGNVQEADYPIKQDQLLVTWVEDKVVQSFGIQQSDAYQFSNYVEAIFEIVGNEEVRSVTVKGIDVQSNAVPVKEKLFTVSDTKGQANQSTVWQLQIGLYIIALIFNILVGKTMLAVYQIEVEVPHIKNLFAADMAP
ncbi:hypothetical protein FGO68_gene15286 [Halteria grandinella]|uniref:Uncharacterized protein n=1 Tax=Halteria grandinella TaxID=5974 RepID=A0A8J8T9C3_HALGN|nr:hypothetical protein FGO68_gene15286 [Halteria grandinella]